MRPTGPKFLHFHAVFGEKIGQIIGWRSPQELAPPLGNPGSATDHVNTFCMAHLTH